MTSKIAQRIAGLRLHPASLLSSFFLFGMASLHVAVFVMSYWGAYQLRFDFGVPQEFWKVFLATLPLVLLIKVPIFFATSHFHNWSRHIAFYDLVSLAVAGLSSLICLAAANQFLEVYFIPRAVLLIDFAATILLVGLIRSSWRLFYEHAWPLVIGEQKSRAILVGAKFADMVFAQRLQTHSSFPYKIIGFLDRDDKFRGRNVGGIPILGSITQLETVAKRRMADEVIIVAGSLTGSELRDLMGRCEEAELKPKIIPPFAKLLEGNKQIPVMPIEISDLLRREPVELDVTALRQLFEDSTVFVTGAGGSIGSEICRQLLAFPLNTLVLVERSEPALFKVENELRSIKSNCRIVNALGDVTDAGRMRSLIETYNPDVILHVAAHKHVPMLELHPGEAIKNNVFGTALMADLADEYSVSHFVYISTDKVVNPSSIMGVSKHIAEDYVHAMSKESNTKFVVVRFGNVLGSAGSVVPYFQDQIRKGGPLTVTHPEMKRFFMAIHEASQLVLQAASMGNGGEIFVLDMGEQIKIVDLAKDLIRLSGFHGSAIDIAFTGIRPGEKLYEELYFDDEQRFPTGHPKLHSAIHRPIALGELREALAELRYLVNGDPSILISRLKELVPEFKEPDYSVTKTVSAETENHLLDLNEYQNIGGRI